jgi:hypothetical protein
MRVHVCTVGQIAVALDPQMRLVAVGVFVAQGECGPGARPVTGRQGLVSIAGDERSHKRAMGLRGGQR